MHNDTIGAYCWSGKNLRFIAGVLRLLYPLSRLSRAWLSPFPLDGLYLYTI